MYEDVLHFEHNRMQINTAYHRIAHSTNQGEAGRSIGASEHRQGCPGQIVRDHQISILKESCFFFPEIFQRYPEVSGIIRYRKQSHQSGTLLEDLNVLTASQCWLTIPCETKVTTAAFASWVKKATPSRFFTAPVARLGWKLARHRQLGRLWLQQLALGQLAPV